jgi:prepilin-type N-terminal cleavage/methylation domain-containing protein
MTVLRSRRLRSADGLTLIEMLMAMAVSTVVFMVLYTILSAALDAYALGQMRSNVVQTGRQTLDMIAVELRNAEEVYYAYDDSILFRFKTYEQTDAVNITEVERWVKYAFRPVYGYIIRDDAPFSGTNERIFADGVYDLTLNYWDPVFGVATGQDDLRYVGIDMRLRHDDYEVTLHNLVTLQNPRKVNYP